MELKKYKGVQYFGHFLNIYETSVGGIVLVIVLVTELVIVFFYIGKYPYPPPWQHKPYHIFRIKLRIGRLVEVAAETTLCLHAINSR